MHSFLGGFSSTQLLMPQNSLLCSHVYCKLIWRNNVHTPIRLSKTKPLSPHEHPVHYHWQMIYHGIFWSSTERVCIGSNNWPTWRWLKAKHHLEKWVSGLWEWWTSFPCPMIWMLINQSWQCCLLHSPWLTMTLLGEQSWFSQNPPKKQWDLLNQNWEVQVLLGAGARTQLLGILELEPVPLLLTTHIQRHKHWELLSENL